MHPSALSPQWLSTRRSSSTQTSSHSTHPLECCNQRRSSFLTAQEHNWELMTITAMEKHFSEHYVYIGRLLGNQNRFHTPSTNLRKALLQILFQKKWGWPKLSSQPQSPCRSFVTPGWQHSKPSWHNSGAIYQSKTMFSSAGFWKCPKSQEFFFYTSVRAFYSRIEKCWEIIWVQNKAFLGSNIIVKKAIQSKCRLPPVNTAQTAGILTRPLKICLKKQNIF